MVPMHVGQQHEVNVAQPRIVTGGEVVGWVVEQAYAGWVLEHDRSIVRTKLSCVRADWRDLHVLGQRR
jgi:hypothetical protein